MSVQTCSNVRGRAARRNAFNLASPPRRQAALFVGVYGFLTVTCRLVASGHSDGHSGLAAGYREM
jgi:hypothetical protein